MKRLLTLLFGILLLVGTWSPTSATQATPQKVHHRAAVASFGTALEGSALTGHGPAATAYDPTTDTIYVGNGFSPNGDSLGGNTVSVIDGRRCDARSVAGCRGRWPTLTVGNEPSALAIDAAHDTLFTANIDDNTVTVSDIGHCHAGDRSGCGSPTVATIAVGGGAYALHLDQATRTIYVANLADGSVSMIDSSTCNADHPEGCPTGPATSFPVPDGPVDIDVNALTHTAYVATLAGFDAVDTTTCNAITQAGCANRGHYQICDGCFGPFSVRVDESTNTIYEPDGSNAIVAMDGRACNAGDLAGCATAPTGTVQLPGTSYSHVVYLAVDETLKSVYVLNHKDDTVVMIDGTVCNGRHPAACDGLKPEFVHTGTNPLGIGLDEGTHTLYVANQLDDDLSVIDAARCSAKDRAGCRRLPTRIHLDSPRGVAVSEPVHTAFVASGSDEVTMFDIRECNMALVSGCAGPHPTVTVGDDASAIAVDDGRHTAYVADAGGGVSVLDTHKCNAHPSGCAVVGTLAVPQGSPADVVVNQKTGTLYVAASKAGQSDAVVAFDASTCNATTTSGCGQQGGLMPIGPVSTCGDPQATSRLALAVDQPTNTVYAAQIPCDESVVADSVLVYDGRHCRSGDLSGCGAPVAKIRAGDDPFGLAVDEATRTLYAPLLGNGELSGAVAVIDVRSCNATITSGCGQVAARAPAGFGSLGVAVDARSHDIYVTNDEDASVSVIDGTACRAGRTAGCARTPALLPTDDYPAAWIALAPSVGTAYVTSGAKGTVSLLPMVRRW